MRRDDVSAAEMKRFAAAIECPLLLIVGGGVWRAAAHAGPESASSRTAARCSCRRRALGPPRPAGDRDPRGPRLVRGGGGELGARRVARLSLTRPQSSAANGLVQAAALRVRVPAVVGRSPTRRARAPRRPRWTPRVGTASMSTRSETVICSRLRPTFASSPSRRSRRCSICSGRAGRDASHRRGARRGAVPGRRCRRSAAAGSAAGVASARRGRPGRRSAFQR